MLEGIAPILVPVPMVLNPWQEQQQRELGYRAGGGVGLHIGVSVVGGNPVSATTNYLGSNVDGILTQAAPPIAHIQYQSIGNIPQGLGTNDFVP